MTNFVHSILRVAAWILVILGVLFTVLQAFLIGIPALVAGCELLWVTRQKVVTGQDGSSRLAYAGPNDGRFFDPLEKNDSTSLNYIPDDADGANPLFGFNDQSRNPDHDRFSN